MSTHDENQAPEPEPTKVPKRRTGGFEPFWWATFEFRRWMTDGNIRRMTYEQRGRFADVWALACAISHPGVPGVMMEDDVRAWAGYTPMEWKVARPVFAPLFRVTRSGKWVLEHVRESHQAALEAQKTRLAVSKAGVDKRRKNKELATGGQQQVLPMVQPPVPPDGQSGQPSVNQSIRCVDKEILRSKEIDRSAVTGLSGLSRPETRDRAPAGGETRGGAPQSAGACFLAVSDILAGVLGEGQSADSRPQRGGAV